MTNQIDRLLIPPEVALPPGFLSRGILEIASKGFRISRRLIGAFLQEQLEILYYHDHQGRNTWRPNSVGRVLARIEARGLIYRQIIDEELHVQLTPEGRSRLDQIWIGDLTLPQAPASWDGEWRVVFFDVPEERKALRAVFRRKLQSLGFRFLQRSVWIYPHPCEDVLTELAERLKLGHCVRVAVVRSLSSDELFRVNFSLLPPTDDQVKPIDQLRAPTSINDHNPSNTTAMHDRSNLSHQSVFSEQEDLEPMDELES